MPTRISLTTAMRAPRRWRRFLILAAIAVIIAVGMSVAWHEFHPVRIAVRDAIAVASTYAGQPPYFAGWLVYVGVIGWFASGTLAALTGYLAQRQGGQPRLVWLMYGFAFLTYLLAADDLFMFHDGFLFLAFGIGEPISMSVLVALALVWGLIFFKDLLADPDMPILALAVVFFAYSVLGEFLEKVDIIVPLNEEATKLAAVFLWTAWTISFVLRHVTLRVSRHATEPVPVIRGGE